jgi:hypothetical protein
MNRHRWTRHLTKGVRVGIVFTLLSAGALIFFVFVTRELYSTPFFASIIVFQLSFIWTCAEILMGRMKAKSALISRPATTPRIDRSNKKAVGSLNGLSGEKLTVIKPAPAPDAKLSCREPSPMWSPKRGFRG